MTARSVAPAPEPNKKSEALEQESANQQTARERMARLLTVMVALSGVLPIVVIGSVAVEVLRRQSESAAQESLGAVAKQAAGRIGAYMASQRETLRAVAAAGAGSPQAAFRLEEVVLDAPSLGRVTLVGPDNPGAELPPKLDKTAVSEAQGGKEVSSEIYIADDLTPAMDTCIPARARPGHAVCAQLDLLELWRFVQGIHVGHSGYALAFDSKGRVLASGAGPLRAAILTGETVVESQAAVRAVGNIVSAPKRYDGPLGEEVLAGWALLEKQGWTIVVEQPVKEALGAARVAWYAMGLLAAIGLFLSITVGMRQSRRMLSMLELAERWNTAGRIAAGITHDLGHRVAILQQTAGLAETGNPEFLPRIRDNLKSEAATLRKFVADFADLSRDVKKLDLYAVELNGFAQSVSRSAQPHAEKYDIRLTVSLAPDPPWVKADRYLLERAVMNLLSNAIDAAPKGSEVQILVAREPKHVVLSVADKGHGIEAERLPKLFDAFRSTKRTGAHVGMGLPNVKRIVEAHGGVVSVESKVGEGTTFHIALPAIEAPAASPPKTGFTPRPIQT